MDADSKATRSPTVDEIAMFAFILWSQENGDDIDADYWLQAKTELTARAKQLSESNDYTSFPSRPIKDSSFVINQKLVN